VIAFALVPQVNWFSGKPCVSKTAGFRARCIGGIPRTGPRLCVLRKSAGFQPCGGGAEKNARVQSVLRRFAPSRSCPAPAPRCVTEIGGFPATRRRLRQKYARVQSADRASGPWTPRQWPRPRCRSLDTGTKKKARRENPPRFEDGWRFNVDRLPATLEQQLFRSPRNLAPIAHGWTQHACHNAATPPRNDALTTPRHDTRCHFSLCTPCWT